MSGDFPFAAKIVSPVKCIEKPWDLWVSEIGHLSPRRDEEAPDKARGAHPYKTERRPRRATHNRLKLDTMSLHGLFPQMDNLNATVCHMCGVVVKCSSAYRHLLDSHTDTEPILPPPAAPTVKLKVKRHKKDIPPPLPIDLLPVKIETSPVHTATPPLSRIVLPQPELYLGEPSTSSAVTGEVQVCVESGELPVVSIQDTDDLPLGDTITDDIFEIINQEAHGSDDIQNVADWNNIIRDIGNMQEINFPQTTDTHSQDLYPNIDAATLSAYTITDADLSNVQFQTSTPPMLPPIVDTKVVNLNPPLSKAIPTATPPAPSAPTPRVTTRTKSTKTKFNLREYDPNKHCGVVTADNPKPCTRSLTCKAHALSLRRTVEGRAKPFDTLLAEHRAAREPPPPPPAPLHLTSFNGLTADQHVNNIYQSLLSVEETGTGLTDATSLSTLVVTPLGGELLLPDEAEAALRLASPAASTRPPEDAVPVSAPAAPPDVCWYTSCPRPLALCTFNAAHAGGAITLGKKFATVRSNIKSSLTRSQCKSTGGTNSYYYNPNALSLSKTVHMNASKTNKPEVRKLIVTCSASESGTDVQQALSSLFGEATGTRRVLNGHVVSAGAGGGGGGTGSKARARRPPPDLAFALDSLLADEKC